MNYLKEIREHDKIRFFGLIVTCIILTLACFIAVIFGNALTSSNLESGLFFWGYKPVVIISGSMEPDMKVNGISIVKQVDNIDNIEIGDILMFDTVEEGLVMHRAVDKDQFGIITKGDNNKFRDNWRVTNDNLRGEVVYINNDIADLVTILFGDLDNINQKHVLFGIVILVLMVILFCIAVNFMYDYIKVRLFVAKNGSSVITDSLGYHDDRVTREDINKLLKLANADLSFINKCILMYYVMKLYNNFREEEKIVIKGRKLYNSADKLALSMLNKEVERKSKQLDNLKASQEKALNEYEVIRNLNDDYSNSNTYHIEAKPCDNSSEFKSDNYDQSSDNKIE